MEERVEELIWVIEDRFWIDHTKDYTTQEASKILGVKQIKMVSWQYDVNWIHYLIKTWKLKSKKVRWYRNLKVLLVPGINLIYYILWKELITIQI